MLLIFGMLVLIIALILILRFKANTTGKTTPIPSATRQSSALPNPSTFLKPAYQSDALEKDYRRIISKKELSVSDSLVRSKLIAQLGEKSGILNTTPDFTIEYVSAPNQFMVEIKNSSADLAKITTEQWFLNQGLSQQGICNLPVTFYLNNQVSLYYQQHNLQFNPIPNGC